MATRFDASGDRFERSTDLIDYNSAYTFMGWFYRSVDSGAVETLFSMDVSSSRDQIRISATDVFHSNVNGTVQNGVLTLSTGQWYHVCGVRNSSTDFTIYLDGVSDGTNTTNTGARAAATRMNIASFGASTNPFSGRCYALKAWAAALTQAEILREMRTIHPVRALNLYAWWPCLSGSGERVKDYSGNGRDWTEGGTLSDEQPAPISWGLTGIWRHSPTVTQYLQSVAGTLSSSGALTKQTRKSLAGTLSSSGLLVATRVFLKSVAGTLTSSGALVRRTGKNVAGTLTSSGSLLKRTSKSVAGTLSSSGALTAIRLFLRAVGGTLSSSGSLTKQTRKSVAGTLSSSGSLVRQTRKNVAGTLSSSGALIAGRLFFKSLAGTLTSGGSLSTFKFRLQALAHHIARVLTQIRSFLARDARAFTVPADTRNFEVDAMALAQVVKAPAAILDYQIDWSTYLGSDTISTSTWTLEVGLTNVAASNTATTTTIRISGGTAGNKYTATNHVVLASGQEDERSIEIVVQAL